MLWKALYELRKKLISNPKTFGNLTSDFNSQFSKGSIGQILYWELLDDIFLKKV
jgi:hypothetical protein